MKTKILSEKINVVTLGCSKNLVDSEYLMKQLSENGIKIVHDSDSFDSKIVIINTCGFINDARQESVDTILQFVRAKEEGLIDRVYVTGCLSERYKIELSEEIPEVDKYFGVNNLKQILETLGINYRKDLLGERMLTTPKHYAYLKISEGCDRTCSFCAIPGIRGKHQSKSIEDLITEANILALAGVKELILIAQDLTYYGVDMYGKQKLSELLYHLSDIKQFEWIRLHYAYPASFPKSIIQAMKERENICNYLDIPFQHINDSVLKMMKRGINKKNTLKLINFLRKEIPGIKIRTTFMVGHPGEGINEFKELCEFVQQIQFDKLGVFKYSVEEATYAGKNFKESINEDVKENRFNELMEIQRNISNKLNFNKIGDLFKVLIDRREGDFFIARTAFDSPEVDNEVLIKRTKKILNIGEFYKAKITSANDYDLFAEVIQ